MNIPGSIQLGDSAYWNDNAYTDDNGKLYSAAVYTLTYTLAGPAAPVSITGVASGTGWKTTLTTTLSAALAVGTWWWQAVLTATGERVTIGAGELQVTANLAALSTTYDGRSTAETALAAAEAALANFKSSGGLVKNYTIGSRNMTFHDVAQILTVVSYWKARVIAEQTQKSVAQGLGNPRKLHVRFK